MITYTMGINLEYLRIVMIGPTTDMKVAEMVDKIWDIAGAKRLVKEIEK